MKKFTLAFLLFILPAVALGQTNTPTQTPTNTPTITPTPTPASRGPLPPGYYTQVFVNTDNNSTSQVVTETKISAWDNAATSATYSLPAGTLGDILVKGESAWVGGAIGVIGEHLVVVNAGGGTPAPAWATPLPTPTPWAGGVIGDTTVTAALRVQGNTRLGLVTSGTWQGSVVGDTYLPTPLPTYAYTPPTAVPTPTPGLFVPSGTQGGLVAYGASGTPTAGSAPGSAGLLIGSYDTGAGFFAPQWSTPFPTPTPQPTYALPSTNPWSVSSLTNSGVTTLTGNVYAGVGLQVGSSTAASAGQIRAAGNIYSGGNVYANPSVVLPAGGNVQGTSANASSYNSIWFQRARASPYTTQDGDILGRWLFDGYDSTGYKNAAYIQAVADGNSATGSVPARVEVYVSPSGAIVPVKAFSIRANKTVEFEGATETTGTATFRGAVLGTRDSIHCEMLSSGAIAEAGSVVVGAVNRGFIAPRAGSITGYSLIMTETINAGSAVPAIVLSVAGAATVTISPTAGTNVANYATYTRDTYTFTAGQLLGIAVINNTGSSSNWTATNVQAILEVTYN